MLILSIIHGKALKAECGVCRGAVPSCCRTTCRESCMNMRECGVQWGVQCGVQTGRHFSCNAVSICTYLMCSREMRAGICGIIHCTLYFKETPWVQLFFLIFGPLRYTLLHSLWRDPHLNGFSRHFYSLLGFGALTLVFLKIRSSGIWRWVTGTAVQDVSKDGAPCKMRGTARPATQPHIPEDMNACVYLLTSPFPPYVCII